MEKLKTFKHRLAEFSSLLLCCNEITYLFVFSLEIANGLWTESEHSFSSSIHCKQMQKIFITDHTWVMFYFTEQCKGIDLYYYFFEFKQELSLMSSLFYSDY